MELQCPSLEYVYSMTWAEFQIRAFAYRRMQEKKELLTREVAWASLIGSHYNHKKLPKSKELFWKIGNKPNKANDRMKEAIKKAQEDYFKELKQKQNG
jgi:hypothetical protein